jgi:hypothetical protein
VRPCEECIHRRHSPAVQSEAGKSLRLDSANTDLRTTERREQNLALRELPVVGVRGPFSKAELEDYGLRNVIVSGDPALLLHEPLDCQSVRSVRATWARMATGEDQAQALVGNLT